MPSLRLDLLWGLGATGRFRKAECWVPLASERSFCGGGTDDVFLLEAGRSREVRKGRQQMWTFGRRSERR